ncbi:hypothetical protein M9Q43_13050 [Flavobacterium sp. HXWNR29]|uniref:hypothetical protein n=1 Tax=Flavobacterium odoriferum TaxID=2946604 RepID=UPI0021CB869E|nr:hypothetical protein [Flavobacterium sp. HXWNR29]MCU4190083.1 hypothetical protein [Flavobacterium sp. HXWNR29]
MKKIFNILISLIIISCSNSDDSNNLNSESYLHGSWKVTAMNKETGENLLILCSNGELPSYTFTSNNELNTLLWIGSASTVGACQSEIVFYDYSYNPDTKILTITNPAGSGSSAEYKTQIIEMSENRFKTKYISGNVSMQTTVPNFTTVFERQ